MRALRDTFVLTLIVLALLAFCLILAAGYVANGQAPVTPWYVATGGWGTPLVVGAPPTPIPPQPPTWTPGPTPLPDQWFTGWFQSVSWLYTCPALACKRFGDGHFLIGETALMRPAGPGWFQIEDGWAWGDYVQAWTVRPLLP